jgi:lysozyme
MTTTVSRRPAAELSLSATGLALILRFEGFVPHPYDDLRRAAGYKPITTSLGTPSVEARYPEWQGEKLTGTLTIGYGHTNLSGKPPRIVRGLRMTEPEAFRILRRLLASVYEPAVRRLVRVPLSQGEYDALVSFVYNVGAGALGRSTLLKRLNAGAHADVPAELMKWVRAKGRVLAGLEKRRKAEADLWSDPEPGKPLPPDDDDPGSAPAAPAPVPVALPPVANDPVPPAPPADEGPATSTDPKTIAAIAAALVAAGMLAIAAAWE